MRSKKIVLVSHCILNQNSVVYPLARAKGAFKFVIELINHGVGIIQLPCPELRYLGISRMPMNKNEYDTTEYRNLCLELFIPVLNEITNFIDNGYTILGIIGINESPTCGITGERGVFMEQIYKLLNDNGIKLEFVEVPESYTDDNDSDSLFYKIKESFGF